MQRDRLFWLAMLAAPVYWTVLFLITRPALDLSWPAAQLWLFLSLAVIYPVIEEIVFRGLIQDFLHQHVRWRLPFPISSANLLTSLIFTSLHFINHPPLAAALVFFPSLVFGFFKDRHGRLTSPIVLHVFYNGGYFLLFGAPGA